MPATAPVMSKRIGADKKNPTGTQAKRRPQGGQGSDTDSGIYQVKSHTIIQRRQPPPKFNRPARDTYFDKVLNNSEDSYEESVENDGFYICEDCKMDDGEHNILLNESNKGLLHLPKMQNERRQAPSYLIKVKFDLSVLTSEYALRSRRNRFSDEFYDENEEDESLTEDETPSPQRRPSGRQPSKPTRNASFQRQRQQKPHPKPEVLDRSQNTKTIKRAGARLSQRDNRREPPRSRREPEYSDFDSNEDEQNSEMSVEMQPRRRSVHNDAPPRRAKQQVVERRTTTRLSRQNDDDVRIRRRRVADNYSSESWTEASERSDNSEDTYEHIEVQRRNSRRQNRKVYTTYLEHPHTHIVEIYEYEDDQQARPQGRRVRPRSKTQGPSNGSLGECQLLFKFIVQKWKTNFNCC
ncbi:unnamed protein product [Rodentolepis nana]|uniref:Origin recognition complex subunit 1 n=1 Tax=Rodentolepis nana TaxID=102285 RepID=A0A158QIV6_RODNA|nr:unnamed protein product [Rodentolepis nana]